MSLVGGIMYKGLNSNLKTHNGFQYELNRNYRMDNVKICLNGFHACLDPLDCFYFYYNNDSRYFRCEGLYEPSNVNINYPTKISCNAIYIMNELTLQEMCNISYSNYPHQWQHGLRILKQNNGYILVNNNGVKLFNNNIYERIEIIDENVCFIYIDGVKYLYNLTTKNYTNFDNSIINSVEKFYNTYYKVFIQNKGIILVNITDFNVLYNGTYFMYIKTPINDDVQAVIALTMNNKYYIINKNNPSQLDYYNYPNIDVNNNSRYVLVTHPTDGTYNIFDLYEYRFTYNDWMTNISPVYGDEAIIAQSENGFNILSADGSGDIYNMSFNTVYDMQPAAFHEGYYSTTPFEEYE